ncbi:MAG: hypothetical protein EA368_12885 [Leptolyngbya sp. DLM2.Bin27]|nr:MAG: hypothetical protein EA368_12885 [Leptolyngbya sp. DLM2.Bin27]
MNQRGQKPILHRGRLAGELVNTDDLKHWRGGQTALEPPLLLEPQQHFAHQVGAIAAERQRD